MHKNIIYIEEPQLLFGSNQTSPDPKEGLFLFGPVRSEINPLSIRAGVVGTVGGISLYSNWVERISKAIPAPFESTSSVFYPGFRELFSCYWPSQPSLSVAVSESDISAKLRADSHPEGVYSTVTLFCNAIEKALLNEDARPDIWFIVVPDEVYELARPKSRIPKSERIPSSTKMNSKLAKKLQNEPSLFSVDMDAAIPFTFDMDFHNQLKARLINSKVITQIVRESTLASEIDQTNSRRRLQDAASVAWNISVSTFYKAGGKPWKLAKVRDGVCYVGLVFKKDITGPNEHFACCGAQMFLTDGEGMVFKGRLGPWYSPKTKEYHISKEQAADITHGIIEAYKQQTGNNPKEIFIHGKTRLSEEEWAGFNSVLPEETKIAAIKITRSDELKMYRPGQMPIIRGTAIIQSERLGYLWSTGFIPKMNTYPGWETPNPLRIEITRGTIPMQQVLNDILQLTKLNFNSSVYSDGLPVTLRFADAVGDILTAAPNLSAAPLAFRHYI